MLPKPLTVYGIEIRGRCPICGGDIWIAAQPGHKLVSFRDGVEESIRFASLDHRYRCVSPEQRQRETEETWMPEQRGFMPQALKIEPVWYTRGPAK